MTDDVLLTTNAAAKYIGCSPQQVRTLIRVGKLKAVQVHGTGIHGTPAGYQWRVPFSEAERYKQTSPKKGWPRGQKRL